MSTKKTQHKRAFLTWVAIYPAITFISIAFGDYLIMLHVTLRTLVLTLVLVPLLTYVMLPYLYRKFDKWLNQ